MHSPLLQSPLESAVLLPGKRRDIAEGFVHELCRRQGGIAEAGRGITFELNNNVKQWLLQRAVLACDSDSVYIHIWSGPLVTVAWGRTCSDPFRFCWSEWYVRDCITGGEKSSTCLTQN